MGRTAYCEGRSIVYVKALALALIVAAVGAAAAAAVTHHHGRTIRLQPGDVVMGAGVRCVLDREAGVPRLLCSRVPRARSPFDVELTRDWVTVYRMGYPDDPVFSRRFP